MQLSERLRRMLEAVPTGGSVVLPASAVEEWLQAEPSPPRPQPVDDGPPEPTWRERIWTCPPETRLGTNELAEAMGRPRSWVYRHTSKESGLPQLPHRKLGGELVFLAGEIRDWLNSEEDVIEVADGKTIRVVAEADS